MEQKNKFIYILPVMFGFFIMGFCDLVGISVTYAKEQFQWTETQAGFLYCLSLISVRPPVMLRLPYWESVIPFCRYL